jgi:predicted O-linked N-acetylglucosamine transferase (SPINDLY family)
MPTRSAAGLPEGAFVFGSLNNNYKFNPASADLWAEVLKAVPDSVLWLTKPGAAAQENLWKAFEERGIGRARVIFAPRVERTEDHLARIQCVDLVLDTFPYCSHSSGLDTLWAGVPMVTLEGESFAGRVGSSMLAVAGLRELIAGRVEEYRDLAIDLARDKSRLASIRRRPANAASPLFDMTRFATDLETLYRRMWNDCDTPSRPPLLVD